MPSDDDSQASTTKVYFYIDGNIPYASTIPLPADKITLGDFKKSFDKPNYKYFCKEFDPILSKEVKVELTSDTQKLNKSENGLIELVLLPIYPQKNGGTLPRTLKNAEDSFKLKKRPSAQALSAITDELDFGINRVSMATDPSTFTFFSRRAGEHLAEPYSSDMDEEEDNDDDPILAGSHSSNRTDSPKRGKRNREPKPYVPSTISSASHSDSHSNSLPRLDEIKISMKNSSGLGIQVVDHDGGIFVSSIKPGSAADLCGLLEIGDQIIQVNNVSFEYLNIHQVIAELQKVARSQRTIKMFVAKHPHISDQKSDALSGLCETMPLDVSNWVEETTEAEPPKPFKDLEGPNNNFLNDEDDGITSDEERAAYIDRRNGVGACLVPALHNFRSNNCFGPISPVPRIPPIPKKENDENELLHLPLSTVTDPILILKRMVHPNSGLEITNRKWLKIPFPDSFIGNEMIDWLLQNVTGFNNKKHAVAYANMLLSRGLIKHVLDGKQFDKKRYYFFEDSIISYRKQIEQSQRQQLPKPHLLPANSATTEVTFLGSPTYPPHPNALKPMPVSCGNFPGPSQPFIPSQNSYLTGSRIPTRATQSQPRLPSASLRSPCYPPPPSQPSPCAPGAWRRPPCESPQTNEYASMIHGEINSNYMPMSNFGNGLPPGFTGRSASPPPNTPNTLSANSSTALLIQAPPKIHR